MARSQLADAAFLAGRGQGLLRRRQSQEHRSLMQGPALHESKDPTRCMPTGGSTQMLLLMCAVSGFNAAQCSSAPCRSNASVRFPGGRERQCCCLAASLVLLEGFYCCSVGMVWGQHVCLLFLSNQLRLYKQKGQEGKDNLDSCSKW